LLSSSSYSVFKNARTPLHSRSAAGSMGRNSRTLVLSSFCELIVGERKDGRVGACVSGLAAGNGVGERVCIHLGQPLLRPCSISGLISFWIPEVPDPRSSTIARFLAPLLPSSVPTQPTADAAHARCTTALSNGLTTDHGATSLLHMCSHAARSRPRPLHLRAYASRPPTSAVPLLRVFPN
jgi:hypothetical protein